MDVVRRSRRLALAPALLLGCASAPSAADDVASIRARLAALEAADAAGDVDAIAACYDEDAKLLPPAGGEVRGREAIRAHYAALLAHASLEVAIRSDALHVAAPWAFDRGTTRVVVTPRDGSEPRRERDRYFMILYRGDDGVWRVSRLIWSPQADAP